MKKIVSASKLFSHSLIRYVLGVFLIGASMEAHAAADEEVPQSLRSPLINSWDILCDPLPPSDEEGRVATPSTTPMLTLMNLEPLYKAGLTGKGQTGAVIEPPFTAAIAPGLQGAYINTVERLKYKEEDHSSCVTQTAVSQLPGIGVAPCAQIFLGAGQCIVDGHKVVTLEDAVKLAIRRGAKAINLSFMSFENPKEREEEEEDEKIVQKKKEISREFVRSITYALENNVPVFKSGGNNTEKETELEAVLKSGKYQHDNLLVIAGGFEYSGEVYDREDIYFAEASARLMDPFLRSFLLTGPYQVPVFTYQSTEQRRAKLDEFRRSLEAAEKQPRRDFEAEERAEVEKLTQAGEVDQADLLETKIRERKRPAYDPRLIKGELESSILWVVSGHPVAHDFIPETVKGTSFSSPALMGVYLLLHEYAEKERVLNPVDILTAMRGTAYQKRTFQDNEEAEWYGCGIADGGKALEALKVLEEARRALQGHSYEDSLILWENYLNLLILQARNPEYIVEIVEVFKNTQAYQRATEESQFTMLESFYRHMGSFWPTFYEDQLKERIQAFMLYEKGQYKECRSLIRAIDDKINSYKKIIAIREVESVLHNLLNKKSRFLYKEEGFREAMEKLDTWFNSFITSEQYEVRDSDIIFIEPMSSPKSSLSMEVRGGTLLFKQVLDKIEEAFLNYNHPNFDWHAKKVFLREILELPKKLKPFNIPEDLKERFDALIQETTAREAIREEAELINKALPMGN